MADLLGRQFPTVEAMLRDAEGDLLALADFPVAHWKAAWSTNRLEPAEAGDQAPHRRRRRCPIPKHCSARPTVLVEAPTKAVLHRRYISSGSMACSTDGRPTTKWRSRQG
jgi:putative transposase